MIPRCNRITRPTAQPWQPHNRRWKIGKSPRDADCRLGKERQIKKTFVTRSATLQKVNVCQVNWPNCRPHGTMVGLASYSRSKLVLMAALEILRDVSQAHDADRQEEQHRSSKDQRENEVPAPEHQNEIPQQIKVQKRQTAETSPYTRIVAALSDARRP